MNPLPESAFPKDIPDLDGLLRRLIAAIPRGKVVTCGTLAEVLGDIKAARWIGTWLREHPHDDACPCHRVVRMEGRLGRTTRGDSWQADRLAEDGLSVQGQVLADRSAILDADALRQLCPELAALTPLKQLQSLQKRLRQSVRLEDFADEVVDVGGVDVSYHGDVAVAAYCRVAWPSGQRLWDTTAVLPVRFPYITGYLSFRELPALLAVVEKAEQAGQLAQVIAVDGSGLLHPRGLGIASHLGAMLDRPVVGVTKTLLCGEVDVTDLAPGESRFIVYEGRIAGAVLRSRRGHARPVFLSVGHRMDAQSALRVIAPLFAAHRLPEPIYWADRISRSLARRCPRQQAGP